MITIAILHPGAMGSALGRALVDSGRRAVWLPRDRSEATRRRAERAGLLPQEDLSGCDVVIAVCPPAFAESTAQSIGEFSGLYVDANAISPERAGRVAAIVGRHGASYVDGGIIGPPPTVAGTTRLYLAGAAADDVAALFEDTPLEARVLPGEMSASSLKMTYGAWTKGTVALLLAVREAAARLGVEQALLAEWKLSQPELIERSALASSVAAEKGWRWEEEMREVARTFARAGQPAEFGAAAAEIFGRYRRPGGG